AHPEKFRSQSAEVQKTLLQSTQKPIGSHWLRPRLKDVAVKTNVIIDSVQIVDGRLKLTLNRNETVWCDHVLLATGYQIDGSRYPILDPSLRKAIRLTEDGYPILTTGLETSVPGLYMAGVIAEKTLGPTLRFVTGTCNAGP